MSPFSSAARANTNNFTSKSHYLIEDDAALINQAPLLFAYYEVLGLVRFSQFSAYLTGIFTPPKFPLRCAPLSDTDMNEFFRDLRQGNIFARKAGPLTIRSSIAVVAHNAGLPLYEAFKPLVKQELNNRCTNGKLDPQDLNLSLSLDALERLDKAQPALMQSLQENGYSFYSDHQLRSFFCQKAGVNKEEVSRFLTALLQNKLSPIHPNFGRPYATLLRLAHPSTPTRPYPSRLQEKESLSF